MAAVRAFQRYRGIRVDGVVGPVSWSHLLAGQPTKLPELPIKGLEVQSKSSAQSHAGPNMTPISVWEWPLSRKLAAVIERIPARLPGEAAKEFKAMIQPMALVTALTLIALCCLLSGGVALAIGLLALGLDLGLSLASALQIAALAATEHELDESADEFSHVIITLGVAVFLAGVAKIAARVSGALRAKGPSPLDAAPAPRPTSGIGKVVEPARPLPSPPPLNPALARLRGLSRGDLLRQIRSASGDSEIVLWEQVGYGDIYAPVSAGPETAQSLGVRAGDIIGYKIIEGQQKGSAIADLMNIEKGVAPYLDPFL